MNDFVRRQGEAAHQAARTLQHEGRAVYELQEDRILRTAMEAETLLSEERGGSRVLSMTFRAKSIERLNGCAEKQEAS